MSTVEATKQRKNVQLIEHEEVYHKQYRDTVRICARDTASADVLRVYEVLSNQRANDLIKGYGIPEPCYPHEDDLWIDERVLREIQERTFDNRGKSTYARVIADCSPDPRRPSLLQRGYLKSRYIARPYDNFTEPDDDLPTTIYHDSQGYFIVVQNRNGFYVGDDGSLNCARAQGFPMVNRQFRVEVEVVRMALAKCAWREPPPPLKRWKPIVQQRSVARATQETTIPSDASDATNANDLQASDNTRRGTSPTGSLGVMHPFASEHNIAPSTLSREFPEDLLKMKKPVEPSKQPVKLYRNTIDSAVLCNAVWTAETIIALSSLILDVPAKPDEGDDETVQQWLIDWYEPATWLMETTKDLDPRRAWEHIERHVRGMTSGPTWHAQKRSHPSPITLRHVVGYNKQLRQYTGHNWRSVEVALDREQWWPETTLSYDGPPLELEYEASYGGDAPPAPVIEAEAAEIPDGQVTAITEVEEGQSQAPDRDEEQREPTTDEVAAVPAPVVIEEARLPGMNRVTAEHLGRRIRRRCPGITLDWQPATEDGERVYVGIEYASGQRLYFGGMSEWLQPSPEVATLIEEAIAFHTGMPVDVAAALMERIKQRYPGISLGWRYAREGSERIVVGIEHAPDTYWDLYDPGEWSRRTREQQQLIEEALLYAASLESGGSSPPQDVAEEENDDSAGTGGFEETIQCVDQRLRVGNSVET